MRAAGSNMVVGMCCIMAVSSMARNALGITLSRYHRRSTDNMADDDSLNLDSPPPALRLSGPRPRDQMEIDKTIQRSDGAGIGAPEPAARSWVTKFAHQGRHLLEMRLQSPIAIIMVVLLVLVAVVGFFVYRSKIQRRDDRNNRQSILTPQSVRSPTSSMASASPRGGGSPRAGGSPRVGGSSPRLALRGR